ncbi:unnamed protein product [Aphis gossypii]|uniref:lysozyme n=1 Tax=Aphis gossypii TaxID=80765 RepID=A0A9P0IU03_APHGO|nr:unnamed protein product [Aphis gossypii]
MARHIIFVTAVLCLTALTVSASDDELPPNPPPGVPHIPMDDTCLRCICEAVGQCRPNTKCNGEVCGMYGITKRYWKDSGRHVVSGSKPSDKDAYQKCAINAYCAKRSIFTYMSKYYEDCNEDGKVDCYDYASIHKLGAFACHGKLPDEFIERFVRCFDHS